MNSPDGGTGGGGSSGVRGGAQPAARRPRHISPVLTFETLGGCAGSGGERGEFPGHVREEMSPWPPRLPALVSGARLVG